MNKNVKPNKKRRHHNHIAHKIVVFMLVASIFFGITGFIQLRDIQSVEAVEVSGGGFSVRSVYGSVPENSPWAAQYSQGDYIYIETTNLYPPSPVDAYANVTLSNNCFITTSNSQTVRVQLKQFMQNINGGQALSPNIRAILRVSAKNDYVKSNRTCSISIVTESSYSELNNKSLTLNVPISDDDAPTKGFTTTIGVQKMKEGGGVNDIASFSIEANDFPEKQVNVNAFTDGQCAFDNYGSTANYTNDLPKHRSWRLYAVDDSTVEGNHTCTVRFEVQTSDSRYSGTSISPIKLSIRDNDSSSSTSVSPTTESNSDTNDETDEKDQQDFLQGVFVSGAVGEPLPFAEFDSLTSFNYEEPITFSGVAEPGSVIKLYIFSTPREAEVITDEDGIWQYTVSDLEPGDHRVEMEVVNAAGEVTSERAQIVAFSVLGENTEIASQLQNSETKSSNYRGVTLIIASILMLLATAVIVWRVSKGKPVQYIRHVIKHR